MRSAAILDIGALFLIWLGTFLLVIVAVPVATGAIFLGADGVALLSPIDGAVLMSQPDYAPLWHYYTFAGPALIPTPLGMGWQAFRCCKVDRSERASTPSAVP